MKPITALLLLLLSVSAHATSLTCGGATSQLTFLKATPPIDDAVESVITVTRDQRSTSLRFAGGIDFIGMECRLSKVGRPMVVFQAYCGGSSCRDLDNFGIINPADLRVLLVPSDTNRGEARKIMGNDQPAIANMVSFSRIAEQLYSSTGR